MCHYVVSVFGYFLPDVFLGSVMRVFAVKVKTCDGDVINYSGIFKSSCDAAQDCLKRFGICCIFVKELK